MTVTTRTKLIVALCVVVGVIGVLIQTAVTKASTYYITVNELHDEGSSAVGEESAVSGVIVGASVAWDAEQQNLQFQMKDSGGTRTLHVLYHGDKPDDFTNDWPVIVYGKLNASGNFVADKLLIKCPSKYSAAQNTTAN